MVEDKTSTLSVKLFGAVEVLIDGRAIGPLRREPSKYVLGYLALFEDGDLRVHLSKHFCSGRLSEVLSDIRKALGEQHAYRLSEYSRTRITIDLKDVEVDLRTFEYLLHQAIDSYGAGNSQVAIDALERAIALYNHGPLCQGWDSEITSQALERVVQKREEIRETYIKGLDKFSEMALEKRNYKHAIFVLRTTVKLALNEEDRYHQLIEAQFQIGNIEAALETYELLTKNVKYISPETQHLVQRILKAAVDSPCLLPTGLVSLPNPTNDFIGRDREREALKGALEQKRRLITLDGIGGIGKTRLATQVAHEKALHFQHGIRYIDLQYLQDSTLIAEEVVKTLAAPGKQANETPMNFLKRTLRSAHILLIFDNCEHLLDACKEIICELVDCCPLLHILATSRIALEIEGEKRVSIHGLSYPTETREAMVSQSGAVEALLRYDAVLLWYRRAQDASSTFSLTQEDALIVAELCRHLDGIPLALELAAARVIGMTPQEMLKQLEDRFAFLIKPRQSKDRRHQTLQSVIEWSYKQLDETLQKFYCQLSVFQGGWTVESAIEVCQKPEAEELIEDLRRHSLIQDQRQGDRTRYRMLETLHEFTKQRFLKTDPLSIQKRHRDYYLKCAEEWEPDLVGANQVYWLDRMEADVQNFRAAFEYCHAHLECASPNEPEEAYTLLRLNAAMWQFWKIRGYLTEGRRQLRHALAKTTTKAEATMLAIVPRDTVLAKVYSASSDLAYRQGDLVESRLCAEKGLEIARELENTTNITNTLIMLGTLDRDAGDYTKARQHFQESLEIWEKSGREDLGRPYIHLGVIAFLEANMEEARKLLTISQTLREQTNNVRGLAAVMQVLGHIALMERNLSEARKHYRRTLEIRRPLMDRDDMAWSLDSMAFLAVEAGKLTRAARLLAGTNRLRAELGTNIAQFHKTIHDHYLEKVREDIFPEEWRQGRAWSLEELIEYAFEDEAK